MNTRVPRARLVGATGVAVALASALAGTALSDRNISPAVAGSANRPAVVGARSAKAVPLKDARLKFEINATDRDGGVQLFIDADSWREMSIFDPSGTKIFTSTTSGRMGSQGGTELFLESAEPPFAKLPVPKLLKRFPKGRYAVRGTGLAAERYVGTAVLSHNIPAGPELISPLPQHGPQPVDTTTVAWKPVAPANGSPIIGYQVLVVRPDTGLRALPKVTLDVTMPPTATSLRIPPGFLQAGTEYEWEVLAIERGGNQTLSSSTFTTTA